MSAFEEFIAQILLMFIPDPFIWAIFGLILFVVVLAFIRSPSSTAGFTIFLLIWVMADYIGGPFNAFHMIMLVSGAVVTVLALLKLGNR